VGQTLSTDKGITRQLVGKPDSDMTVVKEFVLDALERHEEGVHGIVRGQGVQHLRGLLNDVCDDLAIVEEKIRTEDLR